MASIVASSFTHTNPATSASAFSLGAAGAIDDILVVFLGSNGGATATIGVTGATVTMTLQKKQLANDVTAVTHCWTGKITGAGTPSITITTADGSGVADCFLVRGASSATPEAITGATFPADTTPYSASVTTSVTASLFNFWVEESTSIFVSWLLSATQLNTDTVTQWSGSAYLLDKSAGTYAMGINSNGSGSNRLSMITLALPSSPTATVLKDWRSVMLPIMTR